MKTQLAKWILLASVVMGCQPRDGQQQPPQVQVLTVPQPPQPSQPNQPPQPPQPPQPSAASEGMGAMGGAVLKVYDVPKGYQTMLAEELQRLLIVGDKPVGKVRQMPGDQLMVLAPEPVHGGVVTLLEALRKAPAPPTPAQNQDIESRYWFVLATPGNTPDSEGLSPIQDALGHIEAKQGPMSFTLLDQLTVRGSDGRESHIESRHASISQRLFPGSGQQTLGNLTVEVHNRSLLNTEIHIRDGQTLVLGQVGYEDPAAARTNAHALQVDGQPTPPQPTQTLFVVARFEQLPSSPLPSP